MEVIVTSLQVGLFPLWRERIQPTYKGVISSSGPMY